MQHAVYYPLWTREAMSEQEKQKNDSFEALAKSLSFNSMSFQKNNLLRQPFPNAENSMSSIDFVVKKDISEPKEPPLLEGDIPTVMLKPLESETPTVQQTKISEIIPPSLEQREPTPPFVPTQQRVVLPRFQENTRFPNAITFQDTTPDALKTTESQNSTESDPLGLIGVILSGKYRITKFLGKGAMGSVYAAKHVLLDTERAMKFLCKDEEVDEVSIKRFIREAKTAEQIQHPNIVRVYDIEEKGRFYYIIMEYVDGEGIASIVRRNGPMTELEAIDVILQAAQGLACIHEANLIHRDIKPSNLMTTKDGIVKIADFGIVKKVKADNTVTSSDIVLGTPQFMAPEQIKNEFIDSRADMYALGSTFYFLVTNRHVFANNNGQIQLLYRVLNDIPSSPQVYNPSLTPELCNIILKMLEKKPENRYQTMEELIQILTQYKEQKYPSMQSNFAIKDIHHNEEQNT